MSLEIALEQRELFLNLKCVTFRSAVYFSMFLRLRAEVQADKQAKPQRQCLAHSYLIGHKDGCGLRHSTDPLCTSDISNGHAFLKVLYNSIYRVLREKKLKTSIRKFLLWCKLKVDNSSHTRHSRNATGHFSSISRNKIPILKREKQHTISPLGTGKNSGKQKKMNRKENHHLPGEQRTRVELRTVVLKQMNCKGQMYKTWGRVPSSLPSSSPP